MDDRRQGRCLCGDVTFDGALNDGAAFGVCHCSMCQLWSGGPGFATEMVDVHVRQTASLTWFSSSEWAERGFCNRCGSSLFYRLRSNAELCFVMVGSLDDSSAFALTEHIFSDEKPLHYDFTGDAPRLTGEDFLSRLERTTK